jgi:hypothetical protein
LRPGEEANIQPRKTSREGCFSVTVRGSARICRKAIESWMASSSEEVSQARRVKTRPRYLTGVPTRTSKRMVSAVILSSAWTMAAVCRWRLPVGAGI